MGFWFKTELLGFADRAQDHIVLVVRSDRNIRIGDVRDASESVIKRFFGLLQGLIQRGDIVAKDAHVADFCFTLFLAFHPADFLADRVAFGFFGFNVED